MVSQWIDIRIIKNMKGNYKPQTGITNICLIAFQIFLSTGSMLSTETA